MPTFAPRFVSLLAIAGIAFWAGPIAAMTILTAADVGSSFTIQFDGNVDGASVDGLSAEAEFTLTSFGQTTEFDIILRNTSSGPITNSGVTAIGFNTNPEISDAGSTGDFDVSVLDDSFPNGFGAIEVCFKTGQSNNCKGGQGGPEIGEEIEFSIALDLASAPTALELDNFGVRYQRIDGAGFDGDSGTGGGGGTPPVPEPSAALVFASGLLLARRVVSRRAR